jgi:hypothetical protein
MVSIRIFILSYQIAYQETKHNRLLHRECIITVKLTGCIQRRLNLLVYGCLLTSLNTMFCENKSRNIWGDGHIIYKMISNCSMHREERKKNLAYLIVMELS